ncbi:MAG: hypothetical protein ACREDD_00955 [Methylocella sp.]
MTFSFAIGQTAARGEIDVLDSVGYGPVAINKSISIVNDGAGTANITAGLDINGVTINAGPSDRVVTGNQTGVGTSGGTLSSYGDNDIDGNTNDNLGVLTTISGN